MKYTYLSPNDFKNHCPCSYYLEAYAQSLFPSSTRLNFCKGNKAQTEENTYIAEYDVISSSGNLLCNLEVSCTEHPDGSYSYATLRKTDTP